MNPAKLMAALPDDLRGAASAVADIGGAADLVGIAEPPPIFAELFAREAGRVGLPPELLAAISGTLANYRPDLIEEGRSGLMGFPDPNNDRSVSIHAIASKDPDALAAVEAAVRDAADKLALARDRTGGLGLAIADYVAGGVCGVIGRAEMEQCRRDTSAVVGAFVAFLARRIPAGRWDLVREMLS